MSTVNKEDYYTNNSSINIHVDNIISFRDFLNAVLSDIKSGEYNIHMIKNLSQTVEKFYNDIDDNCDIFKPNNGKATESKQLIPKTVETYQYSDSDSDDTESIITVVSGMSEPESENAGSPSKSAYSITKFFSHKPYDVSNDDPDFLDDYYGPTTPQNTSLKSRTQEQKVVQSYLEFLKTKVWKKFSDNLLKIKLIKRKPFTEFTADDLFKFVQLSFLNKESYDAYARALIKPLLIPNTGMNEAKGILLITALAVPIAVVPTTSQ
jgi:hypothetical protein